MARELITCWTDYDSAIDRLLAIATYKICIYDEDLAALKLETASRRAAVTRVLQGVHGEALQIAVRDASPLRQQHPLLLKLLTTFNHLAAAQETPPHLAHLRDSMLLIDDKHALIRFERDLPRSKLLINETDELRPYLVRFREIWAEGGDSIIATPLGL